MFGIGTGELLLLLFIALLVLGPERMPKLARDLGKLMGDLRRSSDELREEFLNADKLLDRAAALSDKPAEPVAVPATIPDAGGAVPDAGATPAAATTATEGETAESAPAPTTAVDEAPASGQTDAPASTDERPRDEHETEFDREAREARDRLHDPERAKRAAAEGWKVPTDDAGTSDRWG